jgi:Xaa-Pro aminopeptidase
LGRGSPIPSSSFEPLTGEHYGPGSTFPYSALELDQFRQVQRLAYDIALTVESQLQVGMTELEVCTLIAAAQARNDVAQVFHQPYVWFGRRTLLCADWASQAGPLQANGVAPNTSFLPTEATLAVGVPLIIDLAPVVRGIASDVGYSCVLGLNVMFEDLDRGLARIRSFLLEGVRAGETLLNLYRELDSLLAQRGWENCHQHYPDRALGHLVFPLGHEPDRPSPLPGFGTAAAEGLVAAELAAVEAGSSYPLWNDSPFSDHPAAPGLWAVEPHIGCNGVGVKFEEVLVVTEDDAFWLDDNPLHIERWAAAGYGLQPLGRA